MPVHRKRLQRYEIKARFLTFSCRFRLPLLNNDRIRALFVEYLVAARHRHKFKLVAWVLMPEHVHLLVVPDLPGWSSARWYAGLRDGEVPIDRVDR